MANVYYSCPFVPTELVTACGHTACRPEPARRTAFAGAETEGLCVWAAAFVESLLQQADVGAAVFTTACDQMRRARELYTERAKRPAFLLNVPKTSGATALMLLSDEYRRFARFLGELDGGRESHENLSEYFEVPQNQTVVKDKGLTVVGGPLFDADLEQLRHVIERYGQSIVFNGTETEWKKFRIPCDYTAVKHTPFEAMAESYLSLPAIWKRPAATFFDWLAGHIEACCAVGVIIIQHPFCDYWRAAAHDLKGRLTVPVVTVETGEGGRFSSAALSRLEAFLEQCQQ